MVVRLPSAQTLEAGCGASITGLGEVGDHVAGSKLVSTINGFLVESKLRSISMIAHRPSPSKLEEVGMARRIQGPRYGPYSGVDALNIYDQSKATRRTIKPLKEDASVDIGL